MKRYRFSALGIEITRRCNKKCPHCARGSTQNMTMSEEVIDRIINNAESVEHVTIGSGEALACLKLLTGIMIDVCFSVLRLKYFVSLNTAGISLNCVARAI